MTENTGLNSKPRNILGKLIRLFARMRFAVIKMFYDFMTRLCFNRLFLSFTLQSNAEFLQHHCYAQSSYIHLLDVDPPRLLRNHLRNENRQDPIPQARLDSLLINSPWEIKLPLESPNRALTDPVLKARFSSLV